MDNNTLQHHGVKGQKWGRRRYQNKDGSLTPAGKKRRNQNDEDVSSMSDQELRTKINRLNLEKRYINLTSTRKSKASSALDAVGKGSSMGSDGNKIVRNAMKLKGKDGSGNDIASKGFGVMGKSARLANKVSDMAEESKHVKNSKSKLANMNDDDLKKVVDRMDLEQQYKSIKKESVNRGKIDAYKVLDVAGDVLAIGASATAIAVAIYNLKNGGK